VERLEGKVVERCYEGNRISRKQPHIFQKKEYVGHLRLKPCPDANTYSVAIGIRMAHLLVMLS